LSGEAKWGQFLDPKKIKEFFQKINDP